MTLWTAIVGVVVVACSTVFTAYQAFLTRDQLRNSISQQRGWLKIDVASTGPGLMINDKEGGLFLIVTATNVGSLPATDVRSSSRLYPLEPLGAKVAKGKRSPVCEKPRNETGVTIFPGESVQLLMERPAISRKEVDAKADAGGKTLFGVAVCVHYRSGQERTTRHTGYFYIVTTKEAVASGFPFPVAVPPGMHARGDRLAFERLGAGDQVD